MIQTFILEILNKPRHLRAADQPFDAFDWNVDQENVTKRSAPIGNNVIYNLHGNTPLNKMTVEAQVELKLHAAQLIKCANNSFVIIDRTCRLCGFKWTTSHDLKLHLLSTEHVNRCEELKD